eukprot:16442482-Heterocapsa_arctica.AAC.1
MIAYTTSLDYKLFINKALKKVMVSLIAHLYERQNAKVHGGKPFDIQHGFRPDDVLSSLLSTAAVEGAIICWRHNLHAHYGFNIRRPSERPTNSL